MNVIINPPNVISVRVGPAQPAAVQSTSTFQGNLQAQPLIQYASDTANTALLVADTAESQVGAAYAEANASYLAANTAATQVGAAYSEANAAYIAANTALIVANTASSQVGAAYLEANTAYALAANSLPITGGTVNGTITITGTIYGNVAVVDAGSF